MRDASPETGSQEGGMEGGEASRPWDDPDYQDRIRTKIRQARQPSMERKQLEQKVKKTRPVSGNKKFLKSYNLEKFGLFGPQ